MTTQTTQRTYTKWRIQAKIRKFDEEGQPVEGQFACGGQLVAVSPIYKSNGVNYRVRPVDPVAFFAAFCFENQIITDALTEDECRHPMALDILEPIFESTKHVFPDLASPRAASDTEVTPSLRNGFSFKLPQKYVTIVQRLQTRPAGKPAAVMFDGGLPGSGLNMEAIQKKIEQMRGQRSATKKKN